jgi:hypothetical protein
VKAAGFICGIFSAITGFTCSKIKLPAKTQTNTNNESLTNNFNGFVSLSTYLISKNFEIKNITDINPATKNILFIYNIFLHFA